METIRVPEHTFSAEELATITWSVSGRQMALSYLAYSVIAGMAMRGLEVPPLVSCVFAVVVFAGMILAYRYIKLNRLYKGSAYANALKPRSLEFEDRGIHVRGQDGLDVITPWSYIIGARMLSNHLLLFVAPGQFVSVRRNLLSDEAFGALEKLVSSRVKRI